MGEIPVRRVGAAAGGFGWARSTRHVAALAAAGGVLCALAWLPTGLAPLLPLGFFLTLRGLAGVRSGRAALLHGAVNGAVRYAVAAHFLLALFRYSPLAVVFYVLAIAFVVPFALLESWGAYALERRTGVPRGVGYALLYIATEKLRTLGDLAFPADLAAHSFGTAPAFLGWASWLGPLGVTLAVVLVAAALSAAIDAWPVRRRAALAFGALAFALWAGPPVTALFTEPPGDTPGPELRVALVQPDVELRDKIDPARADVILERLRALTLRAAEGADLVVWPETARPGLARIRPDGSVADPEVGAIAREAGVPILYGTILGQEDGAGSQYAALYNGAALARPDGTIESWYGKQRLLPFAEQVPYGSFFGLTPRERARGGPRRGYLSMLGNFTPGPEPTVFEIGPARLGVLVCYEGLFPGLVSAYRRAGANAIVVLTNDSWWGRSAFPTWHARMIATRVREFGLPALRAANSGVSSATDATGRLVARTDLYERTVLRTILRPATAPPTFYARAGDWVLAALLVVPAATAVARRVRRRRRPAQPPLREVRPPHEPPLATRSRAS